jgi:hypothetical protein
MRFFAFLVVRESRTTAAAAQNRTESLRFQRSGITASRRAESFRAPIVVAAAARTCHILSRVPWTYVGHTQRTTTFKCNSNCGTRRRRFLGIESPGHRYQTNGRSWVRRLKSVRGMPFAVPYVDRDDNYSGLGRKFFTLACKNSWANAKI